MTACYADESIAEIKKLLGSKQFYVGATGRMNFSAETDVSKIVFLEMTS